MASTPGDWVTTPPPPSPRSSPSRSPSPSYRQLPVTVQLALKKLELERMNNSIQAAKDLGRIAGAEKRGPKAVARVLRSLKSPPKTPRRRKTPDVFFTPNEYPSPPPEAYHTPREYPASPSSSNGSLKRSSPEDVEMDETLYSPISRAKKMRRVHFNNHGTFMDHIMPDIREFNRNGLAGATTPSPFNRTAFKNVRTSRRRSAGSPSSSNGADASPAAPHIPSSPINPPSPMPADPIQDPTSPCPAPRNNRPIRAPSSRIAAAARLRSRANTPNTATATTPSATSNISNTTNPTAHSTVPEPVPELTMATPRTEATFNNRNTNAVRPPTPYPRNNLTSATPDAEITSPSRHANSVVRANVSNTPTNIESQTRRDNLRSSHSRLRTAASVKKTLGRDVKSEPVQPSNGRVTKKVMEELTDDYERLFKPSQTRNSIETTRKEQTSEALSHINTAAQEAAEVARQIEEEKEREKEEQRLRELQEKEEQRLSELKAEEEQRLRDLRANTITTDLSQEWNEKIDKVQNIKNSQTPIANTNLIRHDFGTLIPKTSAEGIGWLNDEIITEFLNKVTAKGLQKTKRSKRADEAPKYHAFSSHLYTKWATAKAKKPGQNPYDEVSRWVSRAKINGKKLLETEQIYIPINDRSHWTLIGISGVKKEITYFDSLGGKGKAYTAFAQDFVAGVLGRDFDGRQWAVVDGRSTRQENGVDCGVFVCMNALALAKGLDPSLVVAADEMPAARRLIAAVLLNGGFSGDLDF